MTAVSGEPPARPRAQWVDPVDITAELSPVADYPGYPGGSASRPPIGTEHSPRNGVPAPPGTPGLRSRAPETLVPQGRSRRPRPGPHDPHAPAAPDTSYNPAGPGTPAAPPGRAARRAQAGDPPDRPAAAPRTGVNHLGSAAFAIVVGAALAVAANLGAVDLLVAVAVMQALLVISWVLGTGLPGRIGGFAVGALAAAGADVVVSKWPHGQLGTLLGVLALAVPAMFVHQLTRGVVRTRVTESLSDIAILVVAVVALPALMQLRHETDGKVMVTVVVLAATGALVVGHLVDAVVPRPRFDPTVSRGFLAVVIATGVATATSYLRLHNSVEFTSGRAAFLGAAVGGVVSLFAVGAAFVEQTSSAPTGPARFLRPIFGVLLPLSLLAPVAYLLCLAIRA